MINRIHMDADNPPPSPTPRYPQYTVAGRMLYNYGEALNLARQLAVDAR
jgi:hypothetical protein